MKTKQKKKQETAEETADYYSSIADSYDFLYREEQLRKIEIVKKHLHAKSPLLDIGCGTGISTNCWGRGIKCIGVDPAPGLLRKMKGRKIMAKAENLPFKDNTFRTVVSFTALHHCNIDKTIKEIRRVSKEDACYAFSILKKAKNFDDIVSKLEKNLGPFKKIDEHQDLILIKNS